MFQSPKTLGGWHKTQRNLYQETEQTPGPGDYDIDYVWMRQN